MGKKVGKTSHDFCCGSFSGRTIRASHFLGPPSYFYSPIPSSSEFEPPTSLGGADAAGSVFPSELRWMVLSPHPSREGRGSLPAGWVWLRANRGGEHESGSGGMGEDEQISTVMGLM